MLSYSMGLYQSEKGPQAEKATTECPEMHQAKVLLGAMGSLRAGELRWAKGYGTFFLEKDQRISS